LVAQTFADGCLSQESLIHFQNNENPSTQNYQEIQNLIFESNRQISVDQRAEYSIPVVFHIVWKEDIENISNEQIESQLDALNDAFLGQNSELYTIPSIFQPFIGNVDIAFCLASRDPSGIRHPGINRVLTSIDKIGDAENLEGRPRIKYSDLGGIDAWDPERYINVWIGRKELGFGEATFPGSTPMEEQGLIIDPSYFGTMGDNIDPNYNQGHVLVHEIGHYFNLKHLFGEDQTCENDDGIDDTPNQANIYSDCPQHPQISCNSSDMFMNFMALTNDHCTRFFTKGQKEMMLSTLNNVRSGLKNTECTFIEVPGSLNDRVSAKFLLIQDLIELEMSLNNNEVLEIKIYDMAGRLHFSNKVSHRKYKILDVQDLSTGIFLLELRIDDERKVEKFFKL
jgi:hypothetical protein